MKKLSIIALLAISVFFTGCGEEGEDKETKTYSNKEKAISKLKWCAEKADYSFEEIKKLLEIDTMNSRGKIKEIFEKAYNEKKFDKINYMNCESAIYGTMN